MLRIFDVFLAIFERLTGWAYRGDPDDPMHPNDRYNLA